MADNKYLGKTAPDLGRSNVYDSAGDGKTFHLNEIPKWRLGNSYSAGFDYFSNAGENIADSEHGIGESRKPTESYDNRGFVKSTKSLSVTRDTKTAVSSSTRLDQSADYTDDGSSHSSNGENHQEEHMLTWRKMLLDPITAGHFLSMQWPRISLRASYKRKEPYVAPDEEDADIYQKEEKTTKRRTKCTIFAIIIGILLIVIAIVPVIVIANLPQDSLNTQLYVKVNMTVEVDTTFTQTLNDPNSQEYKAFTNEFCNEIDKVYKNNTFQGYYGCIVSSLKSGSISVNYIIYFIDTTAQSMETNTELILTSHLNNTSFQLGVFTVISVVVHGVSVESLSSPPLVQRFNPSQVSSALSILDSAETSNVLSAVHLSSTMMSSLEISSTLNIEVSTTQMQTISTLEMSHLETKSISTSMSESTFSETSLLVSLESTSSLDSTAQKDMITSVIQSLIDDEERLTTTSNTLIFDSFSSKIFPTKSSDPKPSATLIQNTADTLTTEISTNEMMSVSISSTENMSMTSSYSTEPTVTKVSFSITTETLPLATLIPNSTITAPNEVSVSDMMSISISLNGHMSMASTHSTEYSMPKVSSTLTTKTTSLPTQSVEVNTTTVLTILKQETMPSIEYMSTERNNISTTTASKVGTTPSTDENTYFNISRIEERTSYLPTAFITDSIILVTTTDKMTPVAPTYKVTSASSTDRMTSLTVKSTNEIRASSNDETGSVSILPINETISPVTVFSTSELITHEFTISTNYTTTTLTTRLTEDTQIFINQSPTEETTMPQTIPPTDDTKTLETILNTKTAITAEGTEASITFSSSNDQTTLVTTQETTTQETVSISDHATSTVNKLSTYVYTTPTASNTPTEQTTVSPDETSILFCSNVTAELYSGPKNITCTIQTLFNYNVFAIKRENEDGELKYAMGFYKNGSIAQNIINDSDINFHFDDSKTLTLTFKNISNTIAGRYDIELRNGTLHLIATIEGYITVLQTNELSCTNLSDARLGSGPRIMKCTIPKLEQFDYIGFYHQSALENSSYGVQLNKNGTIFNQINDNKDINVNLQITSSFFLSITFSNISCEMEGFYRVALMRQIAGDVDEYKGAVGHLQVTNIPNGDATLKLHPDQIAGLNESRSWLNSSCSANIGYPAGEIRIEMLKLGQMEFSSLNVHMYNIIDSNTETCSTLRKVEFGILYSSDMDNAIIRCSVTNDLLADVPVIYSYNETVSLIPIDFCQGKQDSFHPHPLTCTNFVQCKNEKTYGKPCQGNTCFGISETNGCNHCNLVTCPAVVTCSGATALVHTMSVDIVCIVNTTSYTVLNVTFRPSTNDNPSLVAQISSDGIITESDLESNDNILVSIANTNLQETVTITVQNVSCSSEGFYGVIVYSNGEVSGKKEGKLAVSSKPNGNASMVLSPDQIANLTLPREDDDKLHTCIANIGKPAGKIEVEIQLEEGTFQLISPGYTKVNESTDDCMVSREYKFWLPFTSEMYNATLRCKVTNDQFPTDPPIYSNTEKLLLISSDFCDINYNGTNRYHHPTDCNRFVTCVENTEYVTACLNDSCFSSEIGNCNYCSFVDTCP